MKQLFAVLLLFVSTFSFAQQNEVLTVNTKDLPPEIVQQLKDKQKTEAVTKQLEVYGEWAGIGKEIGVAVRDGLTAVKDVAVDFSKTDVGTFTMALIAWKVVGQDVLGVVIGVPLWITIVLVLVWAYKRTCLPYRVVIEDPGLFKYPKKYEVVNSRFDDGGTIFTFAILFVGATIGCATIIF